MENDKNLDELKKQTMPNNSKLEEIMKKEITPESQREFFEIFKDSQLFLPVTYSPNMFEGIENAKVGDVIQPEGQVGFDINYLSDDKGNKAVPLFTSDEAMESAGIQSSAIVIFMSDLAGMLKQTDRYSAIAVNPFTDYDINMPIGAFLGLFEEPSEEEKKFFDSLNDFLKIIKEFSIELEENTSFVLRDDENIIVENSVDGVFIPKLPLNVSSNPRYGEGLKYTNLFLMSKSKKIFPLDPKENELNIVIAPGSEFHLVKELDEFTTVWECKSQAFYEE